MFDLGFPLFYAFLYFSPLLFLWQFFYSKTCKTELWMVRSWIPSFLIPFSFRCFFSKNCKFNFGRWDLGFLLFSCHFPFNVSFWNSSRNELRVGRCGGRGRVHDKYMLNSKHPLRIQSFHGSRGYSIYSFAQLSEHSTGEEELWMVDLGFPLFYTFLISFSFHSFLFKTCKTELWMVRSWIPSFLIPFSFRCFFSKTSNFNFGW